jgi:hypothetical protein
MRTVDGTVYETYKEAAIALQLLFDDTQWENCILDASTYQMLYQLRDLFAMNCIFGPPKDPKLLWDTYKADFEDYSRTHSAELAEQLAVRDIEETLYLHRKSCHEFGLPTPRADLNDMLGGIDIVAIATETDRLPSMLNDAQKEACETILASEEAETYGKCFF